MIKVNRHVFLFIFLLLSTPSVSLAYDVLLRVPVEADVASDVRFVGAMCNIFDASHRHIGQGDGWSSRIDNGGRFTGNVLMTLRANEPAADSADMLAIAVEYTCYIKIKKANGDEFMIKDYTTMPPGYRIRNSRGPFQPKITGRIYWP